MLRRSSASGEARGGPIGQIAWIGGKNMRKLLLGAALAGVVSVMASAPASAAATNWGQEVKECNATSCYPDGTSRGGYVSVQARDGQGPGYAWEIHNLAHPGRSNPTLS